MKTAGSVAGAESANCAAIFERGLRDDRRVSSGDGWKTVWRPLYRGLCRAYPYARYTPKSLLKNSRRHPFEPFETS